MFCYAAPATHPIWHLGFASLMRLKWILEALNIIKSYLQKLIINFPQVCRNDLRSGDWERVGDITKKEIPHRGNVRDSLDLQFQDTYYKISLQAHNEQGFSAQNTIIIKTKRGEKDLQNYICICNREIYSQRAEPSPRSPPHPWPKRATLPDPAASLCLGCWCCGGWPGWPGGCEAGIY